MRVFAECVSACQEVRSAIDSHNLFKKHLYVNFTTIALIATAALLSGIVVWLFLQGRQAALAERLRARDDENARLAAEVATLRTEGARLAALNAQLATQLEAERTAHERLTNEFKALSAEALQHNNESFLKLAQATLEKYQEGAKGELAARQLAVETLVKPLKESLEKVDKKIVDFETSRLGDNKLLAERLKDLGRGAAAAACGGEQTFHGAAVHHLRRQLG